MIMSRRSFCTGEDANVYQLTIKRMQSSSLYLHLCLCQGCLHLRNSYAHEYYFTLMGINSIM